MLELRTKFGNFGNFGNFGHISDGLRKQYSVRTQCCNLIGSEPLYIPCNVNSTRDAPRRRTTISAPDFIQFSYLCVGNNVTEVAFRSDIFSHVY